MGTDFKVHKAIACKVLSQMKKMTEPGIEGQTFPGYSGVSLDVWL